MKIKPIVVIESPFAPRPSCTGCRKIGWAASEEEVERVCDVCKAELAEANAAYLSEAFRDSIARGECPIASHALYPQVLDDTIHEERQQGMKLGWNFLHYALKCVVYEDLGISEGMREGMKMAERLGVLVEFRSLRGDNS